MARQSRLMVIDEAVQQDDDEGIEVPYSITSYGADYVVDVVVQRLKKDQIFIPPFQRKFVWTKNQASRFIESLLIGLPVPGIFLAKEPGSERMIVVDGQQRLRTLEAFYDGLFKGKEFALSGVSRRFRGKTFKTLPESDLNRLKDSIIHATVVKQDHPSNDDSSIYLIFDRLNTGGTQLHPQEIRASIYHGAFARELEELNKTKSWRAIYGPENPRMKDRELLLRFFALLFNSEKYARPMTDALNRFMSANRELKEHNTSELHAAFVPTIDLVHQALGASAFKPGRALNAAVFDAVMVGIARRLRSRSPPSKQSIKVAYDALLADADFKKAYQKSTADEEQVKTRLRLAISAFEGL